MNPMNPIVMKLNGNEYDIDVEGEEDDDYNRQIIQYQNDWINSQYNNNNR
jgi:hypothetical protein